MSTFPTPAYWKVTIEVVDGSRKLVGEIVPKLVELDYRTPDRIDILGGQFRLPHSSKLRFDRSARDWDGFVARLRDYRIVICLEINDRSQADYFAHLLHPDHSIASSGYGFANLQCGFEEHSAVPIRPDKQQAIHHPAQALLNIELSSAAIGGSVLVLWNFTLRRAMPGVGPPPDLSEGLVARYVVGDKEQTFKGCIFCRRTRFNGQRHFMFHVRLCSLTSNCRVECSLDDGLQVVLKRREREDTYLRPEPGEFSGSIGTELARLRFLEHDELPGKYIRRDIDLSTIAEAFPTMDRKLTIPPAASLKMIRDEFTNELRPPRLVTSLSKRTIRPDEELSDSDDEPDMEFARLASLSRLSIVDPCYREYIELWNRHCDDERLSGDYFLVDAFVRFVAKHHDRLHDPDMYHKLVHHLGRNMKQGSIDVRLSWKVLKRIPTILSKKYVAAKEPRKPHQCVCGESYSVRVRMNFIECSAKVSICRPRTMLTSQGCAFPKYHLACLNPPLPPRFILHEDSDYWKCPDCRLSLGREGRFTPESSPTAG
jgi:hypothetical protein